MELSFFSVLFNLWLKFFIKIQKNKPRKVGYQRLWKKKQEYIKKKKNEYEWIKRHILFDSLTYRRKVALVSADIYWMLGWLLSHLTLYDFL